MSIRLDRYGISLTKLRSGLEVLAESNLRRVKTSITHKMSEWFIVTAKSVKNGHAKVQ